MHSGIEPAKRPLSVVLKTRLRDVSVFDGRYNWIFSLNLQAAAEDDWECWPLIYKKSKKIKESLLIWWRE